MRLDDTTNTISFLINKEKKYFVLTYNNKCNVLFIIVYLLYVLIYIKTGIFHTCRFYCVLPKLTKDYDRVTIFKIFNSDVSKFNPTIVFKTGFMMLDCHFSEERCRSHVLIYDMQGGSIGHVGSMTIPVLKKFFNQGLVSSKRDTSSSF